MNERDLRRGKRLDNGEWVKGLLHYTLLNEAGKQKSFLSIQHEREPNWFVSEIIDPATISRCTGFHADKSCRGESEADRLIFEGDVVRFYDNPIHNGVICKCIYADWRSGFIYEFLTGNNKGKYTDMRDTWRKYEIIGNIYDNPELLNKNIQEK